MRIRFGRILNQQCQIVRLRCGRNLIQATSTAQIKTFGAIYRENEIYLLRYQGLSPLNSSPTTDADSTPNAALAQRTPARIPQVP